MDSELLAAIGAALGQDRPYRVSPPPGGEGIALSTMQQMPAGAGNSVLAGVMDQDSGMVGWVEETVDEPSQGYVPVDITINLAGPRLAPLRVPIATYNPYFGCAVQWMGFSGGALVTVYTEKHDTIAARLTPSAPELQLLPVDIPIAFAGELLCHCLPGARGAGVIALPRFEPCVPFPTPPGVWHASLDVIPAPDGPVLRWAEQVRDNGPDEVPVHQRGWRDGRVRRWRLPSLSQQGFPSDPAGVWHRLRAALDGPGVPDNGADILIGSVGVPYWHRPSPAAGYRGVWALRHPPEWFPLIWYRFLSASPDSAREAAAWLAWLDRLAAEPSATDSATVGGWREEWSREEGASRLALQHIQRSAQAIADNCRRPGNGVRNPWHSSGNWQYPLALEAFPPGFIDAWTRIPAKFLRLP